MKIKLDCPYARHEPGTMRIWCEKVKTYCAHQYFKSCKGWWALTDEAGKCPAREESHG